AFGYERARAVLALVVAAMLVMTLWLFYVQAFVLHAYCEYCLLSAATTLSLTALVAAARFVKPAPFQKKGPLSVYIFPPHIFLSAICQEERAGQENIFMG